MLQHVARVSLTLTRGRPAWTILVVVVAGVRVHCGWLWTPFNDGVRGFAGNTAMVVSVPRHLDVPLVSPPCSPRVLHQVVVHAPFTSIPHCQHGMVQCRRRTVRIVEHSRTVRTETRTCSIDGHRHWTHLCKGCRQVSFGTRRSVVVAADCRTSHTCVPPTPALRGNVRVLGFTGRTTHISDIFPCSHVPTSLASVVAVFAATIHNLRLGE